MEKCPFYEENSLVRSTPVTTQTAITWIFGANILDTHFFLIIFYLYIITVSNKNVICKMK